ncbi:MAG: hypothetical protein BAJALOKI1v1_1410005 [Promethearchaeota archaeon]|nr:MAG: hypothetical protein BAJALOKI1v1_1410005 [Candidatus Lokiarchaeota archaeon]
MRDKQKIIRELSKGYAPQGEGAKPQIAKVYDLTFKPLVNSKKLEAFFELYGENEVIIKAWAFLGIYQILEKKSYATPENLARLREIIIDILNNNQSITFWSGSIKTETTLRQHHAKRISWLDPYFVFDPVFEYCKSSIGQLDSVIGMLLEEVISKRSDEGVEELLIEHGKTAGQDNYEAKVQLIRAFENLAEISDLENRDAISPIFKHFLERVKEKGEEDFDVSIDEKKKRVLKDELIRIGAKLQLDMEAQILSFIESLDRPFNALNQIAENYKDNEKFCKLLLEKLDTTKNRYFITDILRAIVVVKNNIGNWKELVIDNVKKYELNDADLIIDLNKANLLSEEMIVNYLTKGTQWHLEFIREFLTTHPEILDKWDTLREELVKILKTFADNEFQEKSGTLYYEKKRLALRLIVDLKWNEMMDLALENFKKLSDDELKKIALFAIITSRNNDILDKLRAIMDEDERTQSYVKQFWKYLEARDWQFFY